MREEILSGSITTGPRTKKLEGLISEYVGTEKTVCLNSATAAGDGGSVSEGVL